MARKHTVESTFRLNLNNPLHAKINEVIQGLNPKIYKSKNQFLIEACEVYIAHYGKDDVPLLKDQQLNQYVTKDEFARAKEEIEYSAMNEAKNEVIKLLGGVISGMNVTQVVQAKSIAEVEEQTEDVMDDEDVAGLAMGWMAKGD